MLFGLGNRLGNKFPTAGLLDYYPGAALAFSVQRLRTAYSGPAIRVRRSSDNAEQDINFLTDGSLDTTSMLSFVGASNGFVSRWYDQSLNERNAIQTTATRQPQIVASGVLIAVDGRAAPTYDGTDDHLRITDFTFDLTKFYTLAVAKKTTDTNRVIFGQYDGISTERSLLYEHRADGNYRQYATLSGIAPIPTATTNDFAHSASQEIVEFQYLDAAISIFAQDDEKGITLNGTIPASVRDVSLDFTIGTALLDGAPLLPYLGSIQEILFYDKNMLPRRENLFNNRAAYYGI